MARAVDERELGRRAGVLAHGRDAAVASSGLNATKTVAVEDDATPRARLADRDAVGAARRAVDQHPSLPSGCAWHSSIRIDPSDSTRRARGAGMGGVRPEERARPGRGQCSQIRATSSSVRGSPFKKSKMRGLDRATLASHTARAGRERLRAAAAAAGRPAEPNAGCNTTRARASTSSARACAH